MATMTSSEDIEDLSVSDVIVQNAAPTNRYTEEIDDIDSDELDNVQVAVMYCMCLDLGLTYNVHSADILLFLLFH